jgi:hypothetical protein
LPSPSKVLTTVRISAKKGLGSRWIRTGRAKQARVRKFGSRKMGALEAFCWRHRADLVGIVEGAIGFWKHKCTEILHRSQNVSALQKHKYAVSVFENQPQFQLDADFTKYRMACVTYSSNVQHSISKLCWFKRVGSAGGHTRVGTARNQNSPNWGSF